MSGAAELDTLDGGMVLRPGDGAGPGDLAPWWRPDPELFAVLARIPITAEELQPLVTASPQWRRRPVLLATDRPPPGWLVQQLADRLGVPVIGGPWRGRWAAMRPRTPDGPPLPHPLGASYPFHPTRLAALTGTAQQPGAVLPGHRSTAEERRRFLEQPIPGLHGHLAATGRLLALQPALRAGTEPADAAGIDLAAVRAYLGPHGPVVDRALRSPGAPAVQPVSACITSGLRRLPCYRGVVLRGSTTASGYRPGAVLVEPGYTSAVPDPAADFGGPLTLLIWSTSGRRTGMVRDPGSPEVVVFAANTAFTVLRVHGPLVLLRETPPNATPPDDDRAIVAALERAAEERQLTRPKPIAEPERYRIPTGPEIPG